MDEGIIDKDKKMTVQCDWFNLLLPGCSQHLKPDTETITEEMKTNENHSRIAAETVLGKMLVRDNLERFPYVESGDVCEDADPDDPSFRYWGYLCWYSPQNHDHFRALVFRKNSLRR